MKKADAVKLWESGAMCVVVEFRRSIAETISWRDKTSGKALTAPVVRHTVESGIATITVNERVADDFNVAAFKPPFEKGARVLLQFTELHTEKGNVSARGTLTALES